ncbi:hypothetical protein [Clostridium oryzae]|uniref:hypothetical protein n=1 Tax=Clostridium oryzae TaxID=1450648 RepID=UPI0009A4F1B6|nr:hypothetical protein [Clostridium oryzae]
MKEALIIVLIVVGVCVSWSKMLLSIANKNSKKPIIKSTKTSRYLLAVINIVLLLAMVYLVVKYIMGG